MPPRSRKLATSKTLRHAKISLCVKFEDYLQKHRLSQRELSELLYTDESVISKILRHRIEEFTTDFLVGKLELLYPKIRLHIEASE